MDKYNQELRFQEKFKGLRYKIFDSPADLTEKVFHLLKYDNKNEAYFQANASDFITNMRKTCWEQRKLMESKFTNKALLMLLQDYDYSLLEPNAAICKFIEDNQNNLYNLFLSNTQSRRSTAGKEFECTLALLLQRAGVKAEAQSKIGKEENLSKAVDFVIPSARVYKQSPTKVILLSAKTTLRERWQEVSDEIKRTSVSHIYLATLDETITNDTFSKLEKLNIILVTTKGNKASYQNSNILSFEEFIAMALKQCQS